jgi:hypothetical protein
MAKVTPWHEDEHVYLPGEINPDDRAILKRLGFELLNSSPRRTVAAMPAGWTREWRHCNRACFIRDGLGRTRVSVYLDTPVQGSAPDGRLLKGRQTFMIIEPRFEIQDDGDGGAYVFDRARRIHLRNAQGDIRSWDTQGQAENWLHLEYPGWRSNPTTHWDEAAPDADSTTND